MYGLLGLENIWQLFENLKSEGAKKKKLFIYKFNKCIFADSGTCFVSLQSCSQILIPPFNSRPVILKLWLFWLHSNKRVGSRRSYPLRVCLCERDT